MTGTPRLEVRDCQKHFPGVQALSGVSLTVMPGEIHALLGENGAGKSTLGKIIGGVYAQDAGEILLDGTRLENIDEAAAGQLGIAIVHQEGSLVQQLSIAENIFAGRQPTGFLGMVDRKEMYRRTEKLMKDLGVALDPAAAVRTLSAAQAQVVEIAKALSRDLRLLDSRRADLGAYPHRDRTALRSGAASARHRRRRCLHLPPACRDFSTLRSGDRPQGRHGHRHPHGGRDQRGRADPADGRPRRFVRSRRGRRAPAPSSSRSSTSHRRRR